GGPRAGDPHPEQPRPPLEEEPGRDCSRSGADAREPGPERGCRDRGEARRGEPGVPGVPDRSLTWTRGVDMWTRNVHPHNRRSGRVLAMWTSTFPRGGWSAGREHVKRICQNNLLLVIPTKRIGTGRFSFHPLVNLSYLLSREVICRAIYLDNTPPTPKWTSTRQKRHLTLRNDVDKGISTFPHLRPVTPPPRTHSSP